MVKRIKISERQKEMLAKLVLTEASDFDIIKDKVIANLFMNYEPTVGMYRDGGEYFEQHIIKVKADGEMITPEHLFYYLEYKHKAAGRPLLKQIMLDWLNGKLSKKDNYSLSKNVKLS